MNKDKIFPLRLIGTFGILLLCCSVANASESILTRLSYRLPPERIPEFAQVYEKEIVPAMEAHGLTLSSRQDRATGDSLFSRLFECPSFAVFDAMQKRL